MAVFHYRPIPHSVKEGINIVNSIIIVNMDEIASLPTISGASLRFNAERTCQCVTADVHVHWNTSICSALH